MSKEVAVLATVAAGGLDERAVTWEKLWGSRCWQRGACWSCASNIRHMPHLPHLPHLEHGAHPVLASLGHAFWAACGTIVVLFIFFAALGALEPGDAVELTVIVLALAVLWLAHAWRGLWRDERR